MVRMYAEELVNFKKQRESEFQTDVTESAKAL